MGNNKLTFYNLSLGTQCNVFITFIKGPTPLHSRNKQHFICTDSKTVRVYLNNSECDVFYFILLILTGTSIAICLIDFKMNESFLCLRKFVFCKFFFIYSSALLNDCKYVSVFSINLNIQ